ncbi:phage tail protein [Pseudomonas taetrolens]|uniref:phage tail protein n=1 Tax=Pseudomonas taetrolens TaxID=47884 RepID=UPI003F9AF6AA
MAEQNTLYIAMLTDVGAAQQAKAIANGTPWNITHMGVGDGNGVTPLPSRLQKKLVHENVRMKLNRLTVRADKPVIVAELILPSDIGGWWVREVGLYDSTGTLVAVASYPATYKPTLAQGTGRTQGIRLQILVSSTANITIQDDPTLVMATVNTVREEITKGEAASAVKLKTARKIAVTGDATGDASFDGSANASIALTLADSGVSAGTYSKVTVNAKGLVMGVHSLIQGDIPALDASKITSGTLSRPTSGNAGSATKLQTGRAWTFSGAATGMGWFDGSGDVNVQLALANSGISAGTYSKVTVNAKGLVTGAQSLIQGDIPALDASKITSGTLSRPTSGNAGTATKLQTGRALTFNGAATGMGWFDGSGDVNVQLVLAGLDVSKLVSGTLPVARGGTGGNTPAAARSSLGAGVPSTLYHDPNGYWWDKDTGLFVQWGNRFFGDMPGGKWNVQFNFRYEFDTAPFIVIPVIMEHPNSPDPASHITCAIAENSMSTSGFITSFTEYVSAAQNFGVRWIAVGYRVKPI